MPDDIDENAMLSMWDIAAPSISQEDAVTEASGYNTLQKKANEEVSKQSIEIEKSHKAEDPLFKLYTAAAKHPQMSFGDYCKNIHI